MKKLKIILMITLVLNNLKFKAMIRRLDLEKGYRIEYIRFPILHFVLSEDYNSYFEPHRKYVTIIGEHMKVILSEILKKNNRRMAAKDLWQASKMEIEDFYEQLGIEINAYLIKEPDLKIKESVLETVK